MSGRPVTPPVAADVVIELVDHPGRPVVFVERRFEPHGWALPGGFVEVGETVEAAAVREAREETGLDVTLTELLGVYSDPARDPRGHTVGIVFVGEATGEPVAGDDAGTVGVFNPLSPPPLVFDHGLILADYLHHRRGPVPDL